MALVRYNILMTLLLSVAARSSTVASAFVPSSTKLGWAKANHRAPLHLFDKLFSSLSGGENSGSASSSTQKYPIVADESVMSQKAHGTSEKPVQSNLRWKCDFETADRICNFNRHYAEYAGYWTTTEFLKYVKDEYKEGVSEPIKFYDSVTGKLLFTAPMGRTMAEFLTESQKHGWPSFRDEEVNWDYVRCLKDGECVSVTGAHLGHNIPSNDKRNRYCINLVSVAGMPENE